MKQWITTNWFPLLICASLALVGEWTIAILMFVVILIRTINYLRK